MSEIQQERQDPQVPGAVSPSGAAEATTAGPAQPGPTPRRRHRRVVRTGTETTDVSGVAADEAGSHGENDGRLLRDVPPHWG